MIALFRRLAQGLRHAPLLRSLSPLWDLLRGPYLALMTRFGAAQGIEVHVGGIPMRLHPAFATQNWESVEYASYRAFAAMLRPGDVVFDVGAHLGTYTLVALARIGSSGRVVAYEPHEFTRRHLEKHLVWNGDAGRTLIRSLCCGQERGSATFFFAPGLAEGMNGLVPVDGFAERSVQIVTIDDEVAELGLAPTVVKIDVEGAEWAVLRGAERTLKANRPRLSLSLHPAALAKLGASPEDVLAWLAARGYETHIIGQDHEIHVVATPMKALR